MCEASGRFAGPGSAAALHKDSTMRHLRSSRSWRSLVGAVGCTLFDKNPAPVDPKTPIAEMPSTRFVAYLNNRAPAPPDPAGQCPAYGSFRRLALPLERRHRRGPAAQLPHERRRHGRRRSRSRLQRGTVLGLHERADPAAPVRLRLAPGLQDGPLTACRTASPSNPTG